jgi:RNA polymerase sigma-70 factor (ECF subfamily)
VRRETYIGPWLAEPVDTGSDPESTLEHNESLSIAVLMLLESLSPSERAAFVLREAFGYEYARIAAILDSAEPAVRKQVSRARLHLATGRRTRTTSQHQRRLLEAFLAAARTGDVAGLERVLTVDVVSYSDGGGVVHAARFPVVGRERVVKFVAAFSRWFWNGIDIRWTELNGEPALVLSRSGQVFAGLAVCAEHDGIDALYWLMNPDKLRRISA